MRITADAKQRTEIGLREKAHGLFALKGFHATSTREIAAACGIATGTLFNYFESKEALGLALVGEALEQGRAAAAERLAAVAHRSVEEDLFTLIAYSMRALEPMRGYLAEVMEVGLSPLAAGSLAPAGERIRAGQLEDCMTVLAQHGFGELAGGSTLHLYWTLYLAVLAFWARDISANREASRALADQAVRMFAASIRSSGHDSLSHPIQEGSR